VEVVDRSIGSTINGVSRTSSTNSGGTSSDIVLVGDKSGLYLFDGHIRHPQLSWKIDTLWKAIPDIKKISIFLDVQQQKVYILRIDNLNSLLVGYFKEGISIANIKWAIWKLPGTPSNGAFLDSPFELTLSAGGANIIHFDSTTDWDGSGIESIATLDSTTFDEGYLNQFVAVRLRAVGRGNLDFELVGNDSLDYDDTNLVGEELFRFIPQTLQLNPRREIQ